MVAFIPQTRELEGILRSSTFGSDNTEAEDRRATTFCGGWRWTLSASKEGRFEDIAQATQMVRLAEGGGAAGMPRRCRNVIRESELGRP